MKKLSILLAFHLYAGPTDGLPNVSARPESQHHLYAILDVLYWHATENIAWAQTLHGPTPPSAGDFNSASFGWDPGIRAGLGYNLNHDAWDTQLYYTWFRTSTSDTIPLNSGDVSSIFIGAFVSATSFYKTASLKWNILFNMFDWDLGRNFFVSDRLSFRPFLGIKGGWIHQSLNTHWENPDFTVLHLFNSAEENLKNNFWGVGPKMGVNGKWNFVQRCRNSFGLFGDFQGAFLWGHWSFKDFFHNTLSQTIPALFEPKDLGTLMFGVLMGFSWDAAFNRDRSHFTARLGYEIQDWLNQYQIFEAANGPNKKSLFLQGGVFDLRLDF